MAELSVNNIKKSFIQGKSEIQVLKGITYHFEQNKSYAITGSSGAGKSTFMHILAGLDFPNHGHVYFNGNSIATFSPTEQQKFLNKSLGLVFQQPYLIQELSVIENVMLKEMIAGKSGVPLRSEGGEKKLIDEAMTILEKVGMKENAYQNPFSLSGGQQQRIAIARAIFNKPAFLLADEPTGNLDITTGKAIVELLLECQRQWHMGIIISSHDAYVAERMEKVLHLENGLLI